MKSHKYCLAVVRLESRELLTIAGNTVIAILGSGTAPVGILAGHVLPGFSMINPGQPGNVDTRGHDTATASVALRVAMKFDSDIKILPVIIADSAGFTSPTLMTAGIKAAMNAGADVISISYASDPVDRQTQIDISPDSPTMLLAHLRNVPVIVSAGNDANNNDAQHVWPASDGGNTKILPNVISVASTDQFGVLQSWSNYGAVTTTLAAPGVNIPTTTLNGSESTASGSSFSAPMVAGLVAGIRDARPTEYDADIAADLKRLVTSTPSTVSVTRFGGSLLTFDTIPPQTQFTSAKKRPAPIYMHHELIPTFRPRWRFRRFHRV